MASWPFTVTLRPCSQESEYFLTSYFFYYKNRPLVHTKPVYPLTEIATSWYREFAYTIETGYHRIPLRMQLQPARIRVEGTLVNFAGETLCRMLPFKWNLFGRSLTWYVYFFGFYNEKCDFFVNFSLATIKTDKGELRNCIIVYNSRFWPEHLPPVKDNKQINL